MSAASSVEKPTKNAPHRSRSSHDWAGILVPLQIRQNRVGKTLDAAQVLPQQYRRDARLWLIWGIAATVPLVAATYVMIAQP